MMARSGKVGVSRPARKVILEPCAPGPPLEQLLLRKYQELIRKHLSQIPDALFAEFTRLHFHIAWRLASPKGWDVHALPAGCPVCYRLSGAPPPPECRSCGSRQLAATLASDHGRHFTCRLGVRNYWIPIRLRSETTGIAYLQALERAIHKPRGRNGSNTAGRGSLRRDGAIVMDRAQFGRAARFLELIVHHAQTASLSDLRKADLSRAGRTVIALEREQARLHEGLQRHLPAAPPVPRGTGPESHPEQVIRGLLERIELDYAKPITLKRFARDLGLNGMYLSALFSRIAGIPFKRHLTELRLQKAMELLDDSTRTASDVAFAVGYASENRFRVAFKEATGLSPRAWRETMQANSSRGAL